MAGVKTGGARSASHTEWFKKGTDQKVIRVIVPRGYGQSFWATRDGDTYTPIERKDMELR